jgi:2-dehydropantoate 2-reductase
MAGGRVYIAGAGAIGQIIGAAVEDTAEELVFIDVNSELVERISRFGVVVERQGVSKTLRTRAVTHAQGLPPADFVFVCVKGFATAAAAELVAPAVNDATVVCTLQNGWGNGDILGARFSKDKVVVGVTYNSATVRDGKVVHTGIGPTQVGPLAGADLTRAERVAAFLSSAGLEAHAVADVKQEIWKKLVLNAATLPTAALTGMSAGRLAADPDMLDLVDGVTREAVAVARALGHQIDVAERIELIHAVLARVGDGKASMLQDVEASRRTEIDTITGAVVTVAGDVGVEVPLNRALYALVSGLERARGLA